MPVILTQLAARIAPVLVKKFLMPYIIQQVIPMVIAQLAPMLIMQVVKSYVPGMVQGAADRILSDAREKMLLNESDSTFNQSAATGSDITDAYAEHLQNFAYKYKDSATKIDPSIDPNQTQFGIMAQDLREVNPACIVPTQDGTLTVDTGKLALMNAGVIADLARRLNALEEQI